MPTPLNRETIRRHLEDFALRSLFIEELGWDHGGADTEVTIADKTFVLEVLAHKRGLDVYQHVADTDAIFPDHPTRQKIERVVAKTVREHLIVYAPPDRSVQYWQWVKREPVQPDRPRSEAYHPGEAGERLIQKLEQIVFTLDEEDDLTIIDVSGQVPYLNGGLFDVHDLERDNPEIHIPDAAFENIFAFFDTYPINGISTTDRCITIRRSTSTCWVISSRNTLTRSRWGPITPRRTSPATSAADTIIPFLFDQAKKACPIAIPDSVIADTKLHALADALVDDLESNAEVRVRRIADGSERREVNYFVGKSKKLIDEIDRTLAQHYGFTDEELDFIINYDIKYRMGREADK